MEEHITALRDVVLSEEHKDIFDHLYSCLSILDVKSSSMLGFNSIIIAVFAIFLTRPLAWKDWIAANVGMAAILVSALLLLSVVWVHWSPTPDLIDQKGHAHKLIHIRNSRTVRYRLAWYFSVISLVCLCALLVFRLIESPG